MSYMEKVPLDQLESHPHNVRRDLGDLTELAESIKGMGLLEPLVIAPKGKPGEGFVVIGGHRRLAAAALAGLDAVPCIMRPDLNTQASQIEAMLVENLQRSDLTVMEEADAYAQLELLGVKEAAIAKTTGRSRATVHQRILLAGLPAERREQYEANSLSLEGAVKCAKLRERWLDDEEILTAIDEAGNWAFGTGSYGIDRTIERILDSRKPQPEPEEDDEDALDLAGKRAEREAEWAQRDRERTERIAAQKAARDRMYDWLSGRIATRDEQVAERLIDLAIDVTAQGDGLDRVLPLLGIDPAGEDEDVDDAILRITRETKALSAFDRTLLMALVLSEVTSEYAYLPDHVREMADLGYSMTPEDQALVKVDDDEVA